MKKAEKEEIIEQLIRKGADRPCPRCGNKGVTLVDGYFNQTLQDDASGCVIGGAPSIPTIVTACTNCGFLSQYALGALGLLPSQAWK